METKTIYMENKILYTQSKILYTQNKKIETSLMTSLQFIGYLPMIYSAFGASAAASSTGASSAFGASAFFLPPRRVVLVALAAFLPLV